ncbi:MAG TPA: HisS family protein [Hyphomicrobium sp.]|nr:HisS family protein [Hyphomicrobium sp.]HRO49012.1 HisS family protein [Hyphomicrobium sp.]
MAKKEKDVNRRPAARLPKGMRDIGAAELRETQAMLEKIRAVYERYGFEPLETPAFEYTDSLGKFLPDQDRPNAGVFSFQDEDEQWLSLRYDLTAPLARHVAENFQDLPKPFRRYATGSVWRNEKPGPGRFRQFTQFDADTVGAESIAADAELCMLASDALEALGIPRGQYAIRVSNRKLLDGLMETVGLAAGPDPGQRLTVLRAVDKLDRLGPEGVELLLGEGRKDESGDFTKGAGLQKEQIQTLLAFFTLGSAAAWVGGTADGELYAGRPADDFLVLEPKPEEPGPFLDADAHDGYVFDNLKMLDVWGDILKDSAVGCEGIAELRQIVELAEAAGYGSQRIQLSSAIVRGLEYYTGPVFEAELLIPATDDKGNPVRFGSVGGGGRYDDLVARFTGQKVPATGFSIGVSRLQAALNLIGRAPEPTLGPVVVTVMDRDSLADYQSFVQTLRNAGIRAELYLGNPKKFGRQLEYADKRGSPVVVIQGSNEREAGEVILKDLIEGAKAAAAISDNREWKEARPAQVSVPVANLVEAVREILARHTPQSS